MPRYANRLDANHTAIVRALRNVGARVIELARFGASPDLLVLYRDELHLAEIKTATGSLEDSQRELLRDGWPLEIWRSEGEALRAIGAIEGET